MKPVDQAARYGNQSYYIPPTTPMSHMTTMHHVTQTQSPQYQPYADTRTSSVYNSSNFTSPSLHYHNPDPLQYSKSQALLPSTIQTPSTPFKPSTSPDLSEMYKEMQAFALELFPPPPTTQRNPKPTTIDETLTSLSSIKTDYLQRQRTQGPPESLKHTSLLSSGPLAELQALANDHDARLFSPKTELGLKIDHIQRAAAATDILAQTVLWKPHDLLP